MGAAVRAARRGPGAPVLGAPNTLSTNKSVAPGNTRLATAQPVNQQSNQAQPGCNTPQTANNPACELNNKINNATNNLNNGAAAVAAPVNAVKQLGDTLGGLFEKSAPTPPAQPTGQ